MKHDTDRLKEEDPLHGELEHLLGRLAPRNRPSPQWGSAEHISIGDEITLFFSKTDFRPASTTPLTFGNGQALTYGQVLALGGDFYGIPGAPISDGGSSVSHFQKTVATIETYFTAIAVVVGGIISIGHLMGQVRGFLKTPASAQDPEKPGCFLSAHDLFLQAFATLAEAPQTEVAGILEMIGKDASANGSIMTEVTETYDYARLTKGRYIALLLTNWDHFGRHAWDAYRAGHTVALQQALVARKTQNPADLELAFAMNAFADHYLTDLFSGGHIRNPRKELAEQSSIGSVASLFMHNEDSKNGVLVRNQRGDCWIAYGDGLYSNNWNRRNRAILFETVQRSANEISETFVTGMLPESPDDFAATRLIPDVAEAEQTTRQNRVATAINGAPMFIVNPETSKVLIREDLDDPFCWAWKGGWKTNPISRIKEWSKIKTTEPFQHPGLSGQRSAVPMQVRHYFQMDQKTPPQTGYGHVAMYLPKGTRSGTGNNSSVECAVFPLQVADTSPVMLYRLETADAYSIYYLRLETKPQQPPTHFESLGAAFYAFATPQPGTIPVYLYTGKLNGGPQVYYYSSENGAPPPGYARKSQVAFHAYPAPKFGNV